MVSTWRADTKDTLPADTTNIFCSSVPAISMVARKTFSIFDHQQSIVAYNIEVTSTSVRFPSQLEHSKHNYLCGRGIYIVDEVVSVLLFLWKRHFLHKHQTEGIYTIYEVVSHIVLISVNSEGHCKSVSSYNINKQRQLIQHIDIIVRSSDSKKYVRSNSHERQ
jgi:hypothetical protein